MIEEFYGMHRYAHGEGASRYVGVECVGDIEAVIFAFRCKQLAADLMQRPVVGFEFLPVY